MIVTDASDYPYQACNSPPAIRNNVSCFVAQATLSTRLGIKDLFVEAIRVGHRKENRAGCPHSIRNTSDGIYEVGKAYWSLRSVPMLFGVLLRCISHLCAQIIGDVAYRSPMTTFGGTRIALVRLAVGPATWVGSTATGAPAVIAMTRNQQPEERRTRQKGG